MKSQKTNRSDTPRNLAADVIIIGGRAGLAAAVSAAENGAKVIVLERLKKTGVNTAMAAAFLAVKSPIQKRLKINATREYLSIQKIGGQTNLFTEVFI